MSARIFPTLLIGLMFAASVVYALHGDWRKCIYFAAAGVLNLVVVF